MQIEPESYIIGTAPFCAATPEECPRELGYMPHQLVKSNCWTGNKFQCKFDEYAFKETKLYKDISESIGREEADKINLKFEAFGTAPRI